MKKTLTKNVFSFAFCLLLVAALSVTMTSCTLKKQTSLATDENSVETISKTELGNGQTVFELRVVFSDGSIKDYEIHTDEKTVGQALLKENLIDDEFVTTVDGEKLDFEADGKYWAFYINDKYATKGLGDTLITENEKYSLKAEK